MELQGDSRVYAQFDMRAQLLWIPQNESNEVTCGVRKKDLVLANDVWGHEWVHGATVLAPSLPVVHQGEEPVVSEPMR